MIVNITIAKDGKITADVEGGVGPVCISELLAELDELVGPASTTRLKPEFELDTEVVAILKGVTA